MKLSSLIFLLACVSVTASGQNSLVEFVPNAGQWDDQVLYRADLAGGKVWLEKDRFTFNFHKPEQFAEFHDWYHHSDVRDDESFVFDLHAYQVVFEDASPALLMPRNIKTQYYNFFIGDDPSKWASDLHPFGEVHYDGLYPGIDAVVYSEGINLKYDLVIEPGADPHTITLRYDGIEGMSVDDGNLILQTSVGTLTELEPYAYQIIDGRETQVVCRYLLRGNKLSFYFPEGYDESRRIVIDPTLVASTYSGSSSTVEGYVAAFDTLGNIISGGVSRDFGYPSTIGAYQTAIGDTVSNAGDIAISKLTPDGVALLWATYLGGSRGDVVHSLLTDNNNDLVVMGSTGSGDYPVSGTAYDQTHNGGILDLVLSKLNSTGNSLLASTFIGGSGIDGTNDILYNSEDKTRGEIQVDAANNVYVAVCTKSNDFPTTAGVFQAGYAGGQDGVVFKMDPLFTSLTWSTHIGGTGKDMAYYLRLDGGGNIYIVGSTESADFPTAGATLNPNYLGNHDGFVARLNSTATNLQLVHFVGTAASFDQTHYIELDATGAPFIYGHSDGAMPVTAGVYSNAGSGMYVQKYDADFTTLQASTVFGSGNGTADLVPSGFNIDICDFIYVGGFERVGIAQPIPTTHDAYQSQPNGTLPNGTNFYFMVFDRDLSDSLYATYMGSPSGATTPGDHTHGGTSRYDRLGSLYQAVCNYDGNFPTTNSYSPSKVNTNLFQSDMVVFKFDFEQTVLDADFVPLPSDRGCAPFTVTFQNQSINAATYEWDFGDNNTSTDFIPVHTFNDTGVYTVTLIADNPSVCFLKDTHEVIITVLPRPIADFDFTPPSPVTALTDIDFTDLSIDADSWTWDFDDGNTTTTQHPTHAFQQDGTYNVCLIAADAGGCSDTLCKIIVVNTEGDAVIPTAFTPNGDNLNDKYFVIGFGLRTFEFRIYNRWGQVVFETTDIDTGWDGDFKGEPQPLGVYAYYVRGEKFNGEEIILKGNVTLVR